MNATHAIRAPDERNKRRLLSPEKKSKIFLEAHTSKTPLGKLLRREGICSTDLALKSKKNIEIKYHVHVIRGIQSCLGCGFRM